MNLRTYIGNLDVLGCQSALYKWVVFHNASPQLLAYVFSVTVPTGLIPSAVKSRKYMLCVILDRIPRIPQ